MPDQPTDLHAELAAAANAGYTITFSPPEPGTQPIRVDAESRNGTHKAHTNLMPHVPAQSWAELVNGLVAVLDARAAPQHPPAARPATMTFPDHGVQLQHDRYQLPSQRHQ